MESTANLQDESKVVIVDTALDEEDDYDRQAVIRAERIERLKPYQFQPGQSGNPTGRKPGKSLKEYAKEMLACMTHEERMAYLKGLPKEVIWRMAEGNPTEDRNVSITVPKPILGGMTQGNQATMVEEQSMNTLPEGQNIENKP